MKVCEFCDCITTGWWVEKLVGRWVIQWVFSRFADVWMVCWWVIGCTREIVGMRAVSWLAGMQGMNCSSLKQGDHVVLSWMKTVL